MTQASDKDEDILAGMFVAVQEFVKDAFAGDESEVLKRMDYGDKKVLIHRGGYVILAVFISGQESKSLLQKMDDFVVDVEERYSAFIKKWSGKLEEFTGIDNMMQALLEGDYDKGDWQNQIEEQENVEA